MTDSHSTLDDEVDDEPPEDSRETCWFWDSREGCCHYEPVVIGYGGPCADCPEEEAVVASLPADAALDSDDEHCNWCQRGGEMQSFEGRLFCGEDCANAW